MKIFDGELRVMSLLWKHGELPAKEIADSLGKSVGWKKNTTYTVIQKCIAKGAVERREPGFLCRPLISKEEVQRCETKELVGKLFDGSSNLLFASLLDGKTLTEEQIERLKKMAKEME